MIEVDKMIKINDMIKINLYDVIESKYDRSSLMRIIKNKYKWK